MLDDRNVVARGLGWTAFGYPLNVGLAFATQVLAANLLGRRDFGTYALALSVFMSAALVAQMGLQHSLLRRASAALSRGDKAQARHEILSALGLGVVAALVCGGLLGSPAGREVLDAVFGHTAIAGVAAWVGVKAGLRVLEILLPEALRAFRDYLRVMLYAGLVTNLVFACALGGMLLTSKRASLSDVLMVSAIVSAGVLVLPMVAVARKLRGTGRRPGTAPPSPSRVEPAMWVSTIGLALVAQVDLFLVGALGTESELGDYAAAFRMALLIGLPLVAVNQVITPLIAGWHATGSKARLERTMRATAALALAGSVTVTLIFLVAGRPLLAILFGDESFRDAWPILMILAAGQTVQTWAGSCGFALLMTGHHRTYAQILAVTAPLTLALGVGLYKAMGVEGVALGTATMLTAQNLVQRVWVRRLTGIDTSANVRIAIAEARGWRDRHRPST